ncbi:hypothetical protein [Streptosporangium sandarakinum]|uniref:hypothetical protein n=1 Tax=Streptosporangium sandarakinum TaxID=1260955 RepID=UPI00343D3645
MDGTTRRPALPAYRWLLLVALVLGIAGMHTLGHLGHGGRHDGTPGTGEAALAVHDRGMPGAGGTALAVHGRGVPGTGETAVAVHGRGHGAPEALPGDHGRSGAGAASHLTPDPRGSLSGPGGTLPSSDPSSVCLAVLTSLVLLLAGAAWAWTRRSREARPAGVRPAPLVARPPPPRTALRLARLSVLRI